MLLKSYGNRNRFLDKQDENREKIVMNSGK